jgi:hypothetical protein
MKLTGENRSTGGKTCPSAILSTTNPTWTDLGSNPGLRGGRPAAKRLSYGTVLDSSVGNHIDSSTRYNFLTNVCYCWHSRQAQQVFSFPKRPNKL